MLILSISHKTTLFKGLCIMSKYSKELWAKNTLRLREVIKDLPPFCRNYFVSISDQTSILTQLNYAYDLRIFFNFLIEEIPAFRNKNALELKSDCLNDIELDDLYAFINYLSLYTDPFTGKTVENHERGKARKIASLRSFFKYFYKKQAIKENVCALLDTPKLHEKTIIRLEPNEIADLLDAVESGSTLSPRQKKLNSKNTLRDLAIFTLFLSTGIRVSELVSLDISDINFESDAFTVTRKGGNQTILYFGPEAKKALLNYLAERKEKGTYDLSSPLFISSTTREVSRLTVRAVQNLVKKYTQGAVPLKKISPHKLRSTFGSMLYNEKEDIYIVADVLGHKDVNTTRRYYAAIDEEKRRNASKAVKLRD